MFSNIGCISYGASAVLCGNKLRAQPFSSIAAMDVAECFYCGGEKQRRLLHRSTAHTALKTLVHFFKRHGVEIRFWDAQERLDLLALYKTVCKVQACA